MASENQESSRREQKPRKGKLPYVTNMEISWDAFLEGDELVAVTEPYEAPTFYHIGQREDGFWHVLEVEKYDYSSEPPAVLDAQLARVRGMRLLNADDPELRIEIKAMNLYAMDESPEAKARAEERWKRVQAEVARELAEVKNSKPKKFQILPHERQVPKHHLIKGIYLTYTFGKDK